MGLFKKITSLLGRAQVDNNEASNLLDLGSALHVGATEPMSTLTSVMTTYFESKGKETVTPDELFNEIQIIYNEALILSRQNRDTSLECSILFNLGRLYQDPPKKHIFLKNPMNAMKAHLDQIEQELKTGHSTRPVFDSDATNARQLLAISYYEEALKQAKEVIDTTVEVCCLLNIATVYRFLRNVQQHQRYIKQATDRVEYVTDHTMKAKLIQAIRLEPTL
ncbi:MAG: hypothetical protein KKE17_05545 [Proteobacteria bacterium]|nr:hypothetical protein [Pseudomonadota bacterium]MBU1709455.1 hypothetical protein [Pseudomonadota bacterium]